MLLNILNLLKTILVCYMQMQSRTASKQALQLHLQNRGLWSVKQCKAFTGHRKLTTNTKSLGKAAAMMWSSDERSRISVSAKFRSILTSVFRITKVDSAYSFCACIFKKKWGESTENRNIQRLEKIFYREKSKMINLINLSKDKRVTWI